MNNKLKLILAVVILSFLGWYFLLKQSDYTITFKVNAATGTISQGIMDWSTTQSKSQNELYTLLEKRDFDFIKQQMKKGNQVMEYTWNMESINDSITNVIVGVKDLNHSFYNRLTTPFVPTKFKTEQIEKIKLFKIGLEDHIDDFKIRIDGEKSSEEIYVAYINLKSVLQEKAQSMIQNDASITGYLQKNNIKIIGRPFVEVQNWDFDSEKLDFNYCFPVEKRDDFPSSDVVKFKTLPALKGLKATYFGNFRTSDRAWFALIDYAKRHDYKLSNKPLEHFLANPFNGGEEIEWETQIIIPFDQK